MSLPTPHIAHLTEDDYEHVYEPAEDSFILLDALEADADDLRRSKPTICVEIGSGSGIASTFLSSLLEPNDSLIISTDINRYACEATIKTASANDTTLNPILCNLLDPLLPRLKGEIDVLLFNPPYVPTEIHELEDTQASRDIGGAWAGGEAGMVVTKMILDQLPHLLSPGGRFYLVAVAQNKPKFIAEELLRRGLRVERRAGRELLYVLRIVAT
ncbi:hypothetical protein IAR55_006492 [Kwoniella newhampshirensis]|uniref:Methyltransferase small domain-containing protein n=1 Tax=Kwoniella newhampshirensis TaxID=1651941 RepID=A0AAW0YFC5_9TREE